MAVLFVLDKCRLLLLGAFVIGSLVALCSIATSSVLLSTSVFAATAKRNHGTDCKYTENSFESSLHRTLPYLIQVFLLNWTRSSLLRKRGFYKRPCELHSETAVNSQFRFAFYIFARKIGKLLHYSQR